MHHSISTHSNELSAIFLFCVYHMTHGNTLSHKSTLSWSSWHDSRIKPARRQKEREKTRTTHLWTQQLQVCEPRDVLSFSFQACCVCALVSWHSPSKLACWTTVLHRGIRSILSVNISSLIQFLLLVAGNVSERRRWPLLPLPLGRLHHSRCSGQLPRGKRGCYSRERRPRRRGTRMRERAGGKRPRANR